MDTSYYTQDFYASIRSGCQSSADVIAPTVFELVQPKTVLDIGCGEGHWANKFRQLGCSVIGVDGDYVQDSPLGKDFVPADITGDLSWLPESDLLVCLEVAEHLPFEVSASFIAQLCQLAPDMLFSAAIPGQPGAGHINCQWPTFWQRLFELHGFSMSGMLRDKIWDDERVEPWYRQNAMLVTKNPVKYPGMFPDNNLDRVHPIIAGWIY